MKDITKRQQEVLSFIKNFLTCNKFPPTIREVAGHFSISVKGAYDHLKALEKKRMIQCNQNRSRAIEILHKNDSLDEERMINIPLLGRVAAGVPIFSEENFDGNLTLPFSFLGLGNHFALQIKGDSMIGAGIIDGDMAIIRSQQVAENGEIVVAVSEDDAVTLKRFFKEQNRVKLQSENPAYPPMYCQHVRLLGKLVGIMRRYR